MADVTLSYNGSDILELSNSGSATLKTGGTYCEDDIAVEYVKPSGGGVKRVTGTYTPTSDTPTVVIDGVDMGDWTFLTLEVRARTTTNSKTSGFWLYGGFAHSLNGDKLEYTDILTSTTTQNGTTVTHSVPKANAIQSRKNVLYSAGGSGHYDTGSYAEVSNANNKVELKYSYSLIGGVTYDFVLHYE